MKKKNCISLVIICMITLFVLPHCKKDSSAIPNVYVDFYIYLTQPQFSNLNAVGGWVTVTGGVKGVLVFRKSTNEFVAYERDCPYDPDAANARIEVDQSNIIGVDHNCGSKFDLASNSILNGPATRSMKTYYADYNPTAQTVYVHNN